MDLKKVSVAVEKLLCALMLHQFQQDINTTNCLCLSQRVIPGAKCTSVCISPKKSSGDCISIPMLPVISIE